MITIRTIVLGVWLCLGATTVNLFALSKPEVEFMEHRIDRITGTIKWRLQDYFALLQKRGVLETNETSGDPLKEIKFRVQNLQDPDVQKAFFELNLRDILDPMPSPLNDYDRGRLELVRKHLNACVGSLKTAGRFTVDIHKGFLRFLLTDNPIARLVSKVVLDKIEYHCGEAAMFLEKYGDLEGKDTEVDQLKALYASVRRAVDMLDDRNHEGIADTRVINTRLRHLGR